MSKVLECDVCHTVYPWIRWEILVATNGGDLPSKHYDICSPRCMIVFGEARLPVVPGH